MTVDIGNSRIKWALWQAQTMVADGAQAYVAQQLPEVLDASWSALQKPARVMLACVAGDYLVTAVQHWLQQHWGMVADVMRVTSRFADLQHGYANPAQHGVDRWAALIAARSLYPTAVCVIDCGSAVTADLVDARGQHLGGRILPGLRMLRTALAHGTTQLPAVIDTPLQVVDFATSTAASIHSGTLHMLVASIDEICAAAHARVGKDCELLITGGDAELLLPLLHYPLQHQPQLVMQGMRIVADAGEC